MISFKELFLIKEVSDDIINAVNDSIHKDSLPFDDVFGSYYRIYEEIDAPTPLLNDIMRGLSSDYDFNLEDGTLTRKGSKNSKKIGKFFRGFMENFKKKVHKELKLSGHDEFRKNIKHIYPVFKDTLERNLYLYDLICEKLWSKYKDSLFDITASDGDTEWFKKNEMFIKNSSVIELTNYSIHIAFNRWIKENKDLFIKFILDTGLIYYIYADTSIEKNIVLLGGDYSKLSSNYVIVYSRHPIDVLRMSDFKNIQSCHSPDGDYFDCAISEAKSGGVIAFLVSGDKWKSVKNIQSDEIFSDSSRNVSGIVPDSRIRLRRFSNEDYGDILIPEKRVYGINSRDYKGSAFYRHVLGWAKENTKHSELTDINLSEWELIGGSYEDTQAVDLFRSFFGNVAIYGNVKKRENMNMVDMVTEEWVNFMKTIRLDYPDSFTIEQNVNRITEDNTNPVSTISIWTSFSKDFTKKWAEFLDEHYILDDVVGKLYSDFVRLRNANISAYFGVDETSGKFFITFELNGVDNIDDVMEFTRRCVENANNLNKNKEHIQEELDSFFEYAESNDPYMTKGNNTNILLKVTMRIVKYIKGS